MHADRITSAISAAIAKSGVSKGRLKKTPPPYGTDALAAWLAIMLQANPYKVPAFALMMLNEDQQAIFASVSKAIEGLDVRKADIDRAALESIGAW